MSSVEELEKIFQIERAQTAARNAFSQQDRGAHRGGRGGRGSSRGGRGTRGARGARGGRGGGGRRDGKFASAGAGEAQAGEKRKRAVEPDGATGAGTRGTNAPPVLQAAKKVKTNDGEASSAETS